MFNITVVEMIDGTARRWHFSKLDCSQKSRSKDMGSKRERESWFVERISLSTKRSAISSPKSTICSCQARRPSRIQDFRDFPESRIEDVTLLLHAPAYTYNNVTHTPRIRLFLLFRPVARGACSGVVSTAEERETCQIAVISGTKVKVVEHAL